MFVTKCVLSSVGKGSASTAIQYAREHDIPNLGLGLGFQLATGDFARNGYGFIKAALNRKLGRRRPVFNHDLVDEAEARFLRVSR